MEISEGIPIGKRIAKQPIDNKEANILLEKVKCEEIDNIPDDVSYQSDG